jgi:hypothetical protein
MNAPFFVFNNLALITLHNTILSFEKNLRFLINFGALIPNLFLEFCQHVRFLSESSKNTENAPIEWLRKETTRYFSKIKVYVVSLVLSLVYKTVFGIFLAPLFGLKSVK